MKKFFIIIIIFLSLIFIKLFSNTIINEKVIKDYNNKEYTNLIDSLYILNIFEPYLVYYNKGNILYQQNDYKSAIEQYEKSLKKNPPQDKVCKIRVNLSITMLADIDTNDTENILKKLDMAQAVLYEDGCANKNDDKGKNKKAEDLDYEIEKLKEKYKDQSKDDKNNDNNDDGGNDENLDEDKIKEIEDQLKETNNSANGARQDDMNRYQNYDYSYYSGRRW